jgi:hypothetical protein
MDGGADRIGQGDYTRPMEVRRHDELAELHQAPGAGLSAEYAYSRLDPGEPTVPVGDFAFLNGNQLPAQLLGRGTHFAA